jgi:hypothetical protein
MQGVSHYRRVQECQPAFPTSGEPWVHSCENESRRCKIKHLRTEMEDSKKSIFDQQYRVIAVEGDRLLVRGVVSGEVLTIVNPEPETPLTPEEYPPGKLIALSDPSTGPGN